MKRRSGFVSNSSSSSFIVYGADLSHKEISQLATKHVKEKDAIKEYGSWESFIEELDSDAAWALERVTFPLEAYYVEEVGTYYGLYANPEYLSEKQVKTGLWSEDEIAEVDDLLKEVGKKATVHAGVTYG